MLKTLRPRFIRSSFIQSMLVIGAIGVALGYHGFSYETFLTAIGAQYKSSWGKSRSSRSDDWVVTLPIQISQFRSQPSLPVYNQNLGGGQNLEILPPMAPTRSFWLLFKPQLWGFLFDLDTGASWQWIFCAFSMILLGFLALRRFFKISEYESAALSLAFYFSPFFQFWSLAPTLHVAYFFGVILLLDIMLDTRMNKFQKKTRFLFAGILAYTGVAWVLLFYPPFQFPLILFIFIYMIVNLKRVRSAFAPLLVSGIIAGGLIELFFMDHQLALSAITHTVYPGLRETLGGNFSLLQVFGNSFFSLRHAAPSQLGGNICEAAGFIHFVPAIPLLLWLSNEKSFFTRWWVALLFSLSILLIYQMLGVPRVLGFLTLLIKSTESRSQILMGVLNFFFLGLWLDPRRTRAFSKSASALFVALFIFFGFVLNLWIFQAHIFKILPGLIVTLLGGLTLYCFSLRHTKIAVSLYLILSAGLTAYFNPIGLRGMNQAIEASAPVKMIKQLSEQYPNSVWITLDDFVWANLPRIIPVRSYGGVHLYPNFEFWEKIDPDHRFEKDWNRYAHVNFSLNQFEKLIQIQGASNEINVVFGEDSKLFEKLNISHTIAKCFGYGWVKRFHTGEPLGLGYCVYRLK